MSIISGDRDLLQLATDKIKIRIPDEDVQAQRSKIISHQMSLKYQVTPTEFIDMKALMGDTSG